MPYMLFPIKNARQYYEGDISDFNEVGVKALDDRTLQVTSSASQRPTSFNYLTTIAPTQFIKRLSRNLEMPINGVPVGPMRAI